MIVIKKTGYVKKDNESNARRKSEEPPLSGHEEDEELRRLKRLYLKSGDEETLKSITDNLTVYFREIAHRYTSGIQIDPLVPEAMQQGLREDLNSFDFSMGKSVAEATVNAVENCPDIESAMLEIFPVFLQNTKRLSNILQRHDLGMRSYLALQARTDYQKYLFVSERTDTSCFRCESLHGRLFTGEDLAAKNIIPPLHPNCKCSLVAIDSAAEHVYYQDREAFLRRLEVVLEESGKGAGGVFLLNHNFLDSGADKHTLMWLKINERPAVADRESNEPKWYKKLYDHLLRFSGDFRDTIEAFMDRQKALSVRSDDMLHENFFLGLLYWADTFTFGIVSGLYESIGRYQAEYREDKNVYNFLNMVSVGLVDILHGALFPEEFLSFRHVMDLIGLGALLYGASKFIKAQTGTRSLGEIARERESWYNEWEYEEWYETAKKINDADRERLSEWIYRPDDDLYIRYKDIFDYPKYYDQATGKILWPADDGFASPPSTITLQPGTRIDRYGYDAGSFVSPEGVPYEMRALAPGGSLDPYSVFEVVTPLEVQTGTVAPWFGEPGGGIQHLLPQTIEELLESGIIRRVN